jgi:hypothetical protein
MYKKCNMFYRQKHTFDIVVVLEEFFFFPFDCNHFTHRFNAVNKFNTGGHNEVQTLCTGLNFLQQKET